MALPPLLLAAALVGCATPVTPPSATGASEQAAAARTYHPSIALGGRLSVQYQRNGQDEAVHGGFTWQQTAQATHVELLSPLGQILAIIDVDPGRAVLTQAGQPPRTADDADALAADTLGWPLPVAGLRDWLQGFAVDAQGNRWRAPPGDNASVVTQDGWKITYAGWQPDGEAGAMRPRRIDLTRTTPQAGTVAMRIVIDNWQPA